MIIETYIIRIRKNTVVTTKMNTVAVLPKDTEEMNVDEVRAEHVVNAIKYDILKDFPTTRMYSILK